MEFRYLILQVYQQERRLTFILRITTNIMLQKLLV